MKKTQIPKKLELNRETIRKLYSGYVRGGDDDVVTQNEPECQYDYTDWCVTVGCAY